MKPSNRRLSSLTLALLSTATIAVGCSSPSSSVPPAGNNLGTGAGSGAGASSGEGATGGDGDATGGDGDGNGNGGVNMGMGATGGGTGGNPTNGSTPLVDCSGVAADAVPTLPGGTATTLATAPNLSISEGADQGFLEGPVWANGALYVSQIRVYGDPPPSAIYKLEGSSLVEAFPDSGTNGLAVGNNGELLGTSHKTKGIVRFDTAASGSAPTPVHTGTYNSPNDLAVRADGNIYFTDPNFQCSSCSHPKTPYRLDPAGAATAITSKWDTPNGITLSPDGNTLYVGGKGITHYSLGADGSVSGAEQDFADTGSGQVDGMTVDCAGNLYATLHTQGEVRVYRPDGSPIGNIAVGSNVTNVAFGGPNQSTLYITTFSKELKSVELDIPGFPY